MSVHNYSRHVLRFELSPADTLRTQTSHLDTARENPEYNFLLHQISERANLILDARSLF